MNSAYDNSALRFELTRDSARPPDSGTQSVGTMQKEATGFVRNLSLYFGLRPDESVLASFDHLTAEMNSAYDNSALRFELTRDSARPPDSGKALFCYYMVKKMIEFLLFAECSIKIQL